MRFHDRSDAGRRLAEQLAAFTNLPDVQVLALPRGGVPVAFEIAQRLHEPLDVWVVRKLGAPEIPELAIGAIAPGDIELLSPDIIRHLGIPSEVVGAIAAHERAELDRREKTYRGDRPPVEVAGKTVILVDDGLATGSSMRAAVASLRQRNPTGIVVAVPVAARQVVAQLQREGSQVVCLLTPADLDAVGQWYDDFSQTSDAEVCVLLARAAELAQSRPA
ncbi:phosphoribosyltransferase [Occallatibacter riparius]|uniref:Phosphoribosyltransferase n=1 Tax=Occallatibacter riparius TaxID=1002689 RepID=A0A9J7BQ50_9BACT|nr:phosphoribosyltransferase [Occallatibacter riparius]UWZ84719.1 phosphoribosyltransferase [Occallatibacter riparius]